MLFDVPCRVASLLSVLMLTAFVGNSAYAQPPAPSPEAIRAAAKKALALIEQSTAESRKQRTCFTCHHQALPTLALSLAEQRGFAIDKENFQQQLDRTHDHLERGRERYLEGRGQGGRADTAGYALWTLQSGERPADEITGAVTEFLLNWQEDREHWRCTSDRPPSESSDFTTTFVALRALEHFATKEQKNRVAERKAKALKWLLSAAPADTEDRVFRLRALVLLSAGEDAVRSAAEELLSEQQPDGGWRQTADLESDAYATGTALTAMHEAGALSADDEAYQKGLAFLLSTQKEDGSWHVVSRSDPFQTYYESGFPHGEDQFISIAASSWAAMALSLACSGDVASAD